MMTSAALVASELQQLFERFAALTEDARQACDSGDSASLETALDARDVIASRLEVLRGTLDRSQRALRDAKSRARFDALLHPVRAAAALAAQRNADLAQRAALARTAIGESIDRLRHDTAAQSAYTAVPDRGGSRHLDLTR